MAIAIITQGREITHWQEEFSRQAPELPIYIWPQVPRPEDIRCAVVWNHPTGALSGLPNLGLVCSMGAGVDHVFEDTLLPANIAITRVVGPQIAQNMATYVVAVVLAHHRKLHHWRSLQAQKQWNSQNHVTPVSVGILGLGALGAHVAHVLQVLNIPVSGYSNSRKALAGITSFAGEQELPAFLESTNVLVNLLPLTPATKGFLNARMFAQCQPGTLLINVGRGGHLIEADLLEALDSGQLCGAWLDVFQQEPLPPEHPFWNREEVVITPHISSITNAGEAVQQILENYRRHTMGQPLLHLVNRHKGY